MTQLLDTNDFKKLFLALGFELRDVEKEQRNADTTDVDIKAWYVLRKWRNKLGKKATRSCILNALEKCRNLEAREILENTWNHEGNI